MFIKSRFVILLVVLTAFLFFAGCQCGDDDDDNDDKSDDDDTGDDDDDDDIADDDDDSDDDDDYAGPHYLLVPADLDEDGEPDLAFSVLKPDTPWTYLSVQIYDLDTLALKVESGDYDASYGSATRMRDFDGDGFGEVQFTHTYETSKGDPLESHNCP